MNLQYIAEMEKILNECKAATSDLDAQLDRMEKLKDPMTRLFSYYGSEEWYMDIESELPEGMPAGVLSEDAV